MKKNISLMAILMLCIISVFAQKSTKPRTSAAAQRETTDPEAKELLEKLRQKYEGFSTLEADFSLTIEVPNRKKELQTGKMIQSGERYYVKLSDQEVICDGNSTYLYMKKNKEVQINDANSGSNANSFSPKNMLNMYNEGNYIAYLAGQGTENGKPVSYVEVKPANRNNAAYTKVRLAVDKKNNTVVSMFTANRDGSRFKLNISKLATNKPVNEGLFYFDQSKYPGVHVEDLRTN
jgi:outer membrane lipoprotein carrier protein